MATDKNEKLLTSQEVADFLRVHVNTVLRLAVREEIKTVMIGNRYRFYESSVKDYLKRQRVHAGHHANMGEKEGGAA